MTEWRIYTKFGEEYVGESLSFEWKGFATLLSYYRVKLTKEYFWGKKKKTWHEDRRAVDYMIPLDSISKIERWDVSKKNKKIIPTTHRR